MRRIVFRASVCFSICLDKWFFCDTIKVMMKYVRCRDPRKRSEESAVKIRRNSHYRNSMIAQVGMLALQQGYTNWFVTCLGMKSVAVFEFRRWVFRFLEWKIDCAFQKSAVYFAIGNYVNPPSPVVLLGCKKRDKRATGSGNLPLFYCKNLWASADDGIENKSVWKRNNKYDVFLKFIICDWKNDFLLWEKLQVLCVVCLSW